MNRNEIIGAARKAGMAFHMGMPHESVIEQLTRFAEIVLSNSPAWRDAPTVPGLWVCIGRGEREGDVYQVDLPHLYSKVYGDRWYGPIPEDKP